MRLLDLSEVLPEIPVCKAAELRTGSPQGGMLNPGEERCCLLPFRDSEWRELSNTANITLRPQLSGVNSWCYDHKLQVSSSGKPARWFTVPCHFEWCGKSEVLRLERRQNHIKVRVTSRPFSSQKQFKRTNW